MDQPLVSIITPSFNAMPFIEHTIKSVLMQDYPNIEHIVCDGGSTDGTIEVLKSYPHLKWISEKDNGQSHALNKGFRMAQGQIIGWLNADDTYEQNALSNANAWLSEHPDYDLVCSDVNVIDDNGNIIGISYSRPFNLTEFLVNNMIKQPTVFMRRNVIENLQGVDEKLHYCMDREFWLRAIMGGHSIHYLTEVKLANFRLCKGTKSFVGGSMFSEEWLRVLVASLEKPNFDHLSKSQKTHIINKNSYNLHISRMIEESIKKDRGQVIKHFIKALRKNPESFLKFNTWGMFLVCLLSQPSRLRKYS